MQKLSSIEVKRQNKESVFRHMLQLGTTTKPEIAAALHLSLPTVSTLTGELAQAGLLQETGVQASNGGRRAMGIQISENAKLALGLDISKHHLYFAISNLRGEIIAGERQEYPFQNTPSYFNGIRLRKQDFLLKHQIDVSRLVGQSVSMPGIISQDQQWLEYSHILELKEPLFLRQKDMMDGDYPYVFLNDGSACCMAECYSGAARDSFVYIMLRNTVGGALVQDRRLVEGNNIRSGEIGHICMVPGGKRCYCGKLGHFDAYCSARVLSDQVNGTVEDFFEVLSRGNPEAEAAFEAYLDALARMIYNLHILTDLDIVIGGYVGSHLVPYLPRLKALVESHSIFDEREEFIFLSQYNAEAAAVGGARHCIEEFIKGIN